MDFNYALWGTVIGSILFVILLIKFGLGIVIITDQEVGIVNKKFSSKSLSHGQIIATNGESGIQVDILSPGWKFWYFFWQYEVIKVSPISVPAGQIALIHAKDGKNIPAGRMLGKNVVCDDFQDGRKFLENGGEKGRQSAMLKEGTYRINTELFEVVTKANAGKYGLNQDLLDIIRIPTDMVGIVTTLDGKPIREGEIAGPIIESHENFQNPQAFVDAGGERGLQEQVLLGAVTINPWFAIVKMEPITIVEIGTVGVVISYVGKEHEDVSGEDFKHGDLVNTGHKGVWITPLNPGKHAINPRTMTIVHVPTTNIALNWSDKEEEHGLDERLSELKIRSKDGFAFELAISQIIHVGVKDAPKVIARFGTMDKLINQVLEPAIDNYFRNSAQNDTILEFLETRTQRQEAALAFIKKALQDYNIEAVGTYIGHVHPPEELMQTLRERKLAEENEQTYAIREKSQKALQSLQKEESLAAMQAELVSAEQQANIDKFKAGAAIAKAEGEAKSVTIRAEADATAVELKGKAEAVSVEAIGLAQAKVYNESVKAMGQDNYSRLEAIKAIAEGKVKIIPDTLIMGGGNEGGSPLMMNALIAESLTGKKLFNKEASTTVVADK